MKKLFLLLGLSVMLYADVLEVNNFETDLFSKDRNNLKKIEFSLLFDGRDLKENRHKIIDGLNVVISSFYVEDLFTSQGKEKFKTVITQYITKKYSIDIDDIFIKRFRVLDNVNVDAFIEALRREGFCKENRNRESKSISENFDALDLMK
ncbi:MAG: hypothetical protein K0U47_06560 [Epsilonproteobacteria bacterium]|nr:hypothetical protein [Campylobacterota bacterium]